MMSLQVLSITPLLPPLYILFQLIFIDLVGRAADSDDGGVIASDDASTITTTTSVGAQLLVFLALGILGYAGTHRLIPNIKHYMLKRGICGKDLGRKGNKNENDDV
jgi:hypothetical protein